MEDFGHTRESWLRQFLELANGIPWHDTFGQVWTRICPRVFEARLTRGSLPHLHEYDQWPDLRSVGLAHGIREMGEKVTTETHHDISSLPVDVVRFSEAVRGHWSVENSCHWILDVVFHEDDCCVQIDHVPENLALIRCLAHTLLAQNKSVKRGIKTKHIKAALDESYLLKVLNL